MANAIRESALKSLLRRFEDINLKTKLYERL